MTTHAADTQPTLHIHPVPEVGSQAPSSPKLPLTDGRPTIVVFLRHCGCPFAEKTFKTLSAISDQHEEIQCIAVSHSSTEDTESWIPQVGGTWNVKVVVDTDRELYAQWGLGLYSAWNGASPKVLWSMYKLGTTEGIWNIPMESGSRWQMGGAFAVDRFGFITWAHPSRMADDMPNLTEAVDSVSRK